MSYLRAHVHEADVLRAQLPAEPLEEPHVRREFSAVQVLVQEESGELGHIGGRFHPVEAEEIQLGLVE